MISMQNVVLAGTLAVLVACTPREQLVSKLDQCTLTHGYDPNRTAGIAENALAPNELSWRQCAYDAVRVYAKANPSLADLYLQLIDDDIEMTTAIQQGTLTRSQRRARLQTLIADIRAAEDAQIETLADRGKDGHNPPLVLLYRDELSNLDQSINGFH